MATTVTVDGYSLQNLAYQVDLIEAETPVRRDHDIDLALLHGEVETSGNFEAPLVALRLWVDATDPSGVLSAPTPERQLELNLDMLKRIFLSTSAVTLAITTDGGATRRARVKVAAFSKPTAIAAHTHQITIGLKIIKVFWEAASATEVTFTSLNTWETLTNVAGSTAPITDAIVKVKGSITNPRIDIDGGGYCRYTGSALGSSDWWIFDSGRWLSARGASITLPTEGTKSMGSTDYYGSGVYMLEIPHPYRLRLSGSSASGVEWRVTARPKYL